jgi:hypothetical protein
LPSAISAGLDSRLLRLLEAIDAIPEITVRGKILRRVLRSVGRPLAIDETRTSRREVAVLQG